MEPNGQLIRSLSLKGVPATQYDDDEAVDDEEEDDEEEEDGKRGKWTKSMSGSWRGTKKLLGYSAKEKEESTAYNDGAPLKKSVSTGGFIGA